jgi:hypothetical protein
MIEVELVQRTSQPLLSQCAATVAGPVRTFELVSISGC